MRFESKENCYRDNKTGLEWSLDSYGPMNWSDAVKFTSLIGTGWRLPAIEELITLVDFTKFEPATELPKMLSSLYWSSSTSADHQAYAWLVGFATGGVFSYEKTFNNYVRFVRSPERKER